MLPTSTEYSNTYVHTHLNPQGNLQESEGDQPISSLPASSRSQQQGDASEEPTIDQLVVLSSKPVLMPLDNAHKASTQPDTLSNTTIRLSEVISQLEQRVDRVSSASSTHTPITTASTPINGQNLTDLWQQISSKPQIVCQPWFQNRVMPLHPCRSHCTKLPQGI